MAETNTPLAEVTVTTEEKINLELINPKLKFSNAKIGTSVTSYCEDTPEAREEKRNELTAELAEYMKEERDQLIEDLTS